MAANDRSRNVVIAERLKQERPRLLDDAREAIKRRGAYSVTGVMVAIRKYVQNEDRIARLLETPEESR